MIIGVNSEWFICVCRLGPAIYIDTNYLFLGTAMPQMRNCAVLGCEGAVLPLHCFPSKDRARLKVWVAATGNQAIAALPEGQIIRKFICHKHFEGRYVLGNNKLAKTSVPTLHLPGK